MEISLYGDRYELTLLDEPTWGGLPVVPDGFERSIAVYTYHCTDQGLYLYKHRNSVLEAQYFVPRDKRFPLDQDTAFLEKLQDHSQIRMRFVLTPLTADGTIDLAFRQNYRHGEVVNFCGLWHHDHEVDPYAVYRYVPTLWTPSYFLMEKELDPQVIEERKKNNKLFFEESEIVQWIHMHGILISKVPYFLFDLRQAIKEGLVVGWKS